VKGSEIYGVDGNDRSQRQLNDVVGKGDIIVEGWI